ncbi:hypothetical protein K0A96_01280 [Patescibacteria group bacterium]|nr:hypothetical protein [Patescibacteria group bacterium]
MVTKELIDFIQKSRLFGRSDEQIKSMLTEQGWSAEDIKAGFGSAEFNPPPPEEPIKPEKNSHPKAWIFALIALILIVGLGAGGFFAYQKYIKTEDDPQSENEIVDEGGLGDQDQSQNTEMIFAENLISCTEYKTTFKHLLTEEMLEKEILGIVDGKCQYVEQMPNGGKMDCKYTESERAVAAQYYIDAVLAESTDSEVRVDLETGEQEKTYKINDKVVDNPLEEFMNTGVCVISGY